MWRPDESTWLFLALLAGLHVLATRGTGTLPTHVQETFGASAATVLTRPWAQATALWFHQSWGHLAYNLAVLLATMPFAVAAFGPKALPAMVVASILGGFLVDLVLILPLSSVWQHAAAAVQPRLVGASMAIFAGAGMAWAAWDATSAKAAVAVAWVAYEVALGVFGVTQPFVWAFHLAGGAIGVGMARAMA